MPKRKGLYVKNYRRFVIFLIVLISIAVLVVGVVLFNLSRNSLESAFVPAKIDDDMQYNILEDYYLTLSGDILSRYDYSGEAVWSKKVYDEGLNLYASDKLIVIYSNKNLQVLTVEGDYLYSTDVIGTINKVYCGNNIVAVFSVIVGEDEKKENMIYFYNTSGSLFDSISFFPQYIIDFGFLGGDDLWVLTADPTNVVPVSRIITYKPGVSMTGLINLYSELAYKTYFTADNMYVATTENLIKYDLFGQKLGSNLIYDWEIKAVNLTIGGNFFAIVPRSQNNEPFYSNARIINESVSYKVNLPKNVEDMAMYETNLYLFGQDTIYVYSSKGEYLRQYKLDDKINYISFASGRKVLVKKEGLYYFLDLP
jgi:hypothetical protein